MCKKADNVKTLLNIPHLGAIAHVFDLVCIGGNVCYFVIRYKMLMG